MKPKRSERSEEDGMLEYLEDIIGSSRLKVPIDKFKKKIEIFTNKEEMIQKKLKLAETEVSALVEPVRKVLKLMKFENAITKTKHKIFSIDRFVLKTIKFL
jgi:structural maintenance of chromosome 4